MRSACFLWIGGGEPVSLEGTPAVTQKNSFASSTRALYGGGLLRLWSDHIYARVMAENETPESTQAVLALGKAITANAKASPKPELISRLPVEIGSGWKLRMDRLSFFRSHLVLNSIYYLSHENILDLDLSAEAVMVPYEQRSPSREPRRSQFLLVQYESPERARKALNHFHESYLPEYKMKITADLAAGRPGLFKIEDGWLAFKRLGKYVALVFESPDKETARAILLENEAMVIKKGGNREK